MAVDYVLRVERRALARSEHKAVSLPVRAYPKHVCAGVSRILSRA
jgi:hypothetical protein